MSRKLTRRQFIRDTLKSSAVIASATPLAGLSRIALGDDNEYDYVVVGSGAGGGPVACNLARHGYKVLLMEAGGKQRNSNYVVPAFHGLSTEDPAFSWHFHVKHYSNPASQKSDSKYVPGKGVLYPRAATLGGCTAHNAMITMYPDNSDWDRIADLTGDQSWNSWDMRTYFKRIERNQYTERTTENPQRHGFNGWLTTEQTRLNLLFKDPQLLKIVVDAFKTADPVGDFYEKFLKAGFHLDLDPNDWDAVEKRVDGIFNTPKATDNGQRNGTREHILRTMEEYPQNLILKTHSLATQVLFEGKRAIGVEYVQGERVYEADMYPQNWKTVFSRPQVARARREVILAGGAFNTPQLLMLSGIGPAQELARHRIPVRLNLPGVGQNLQDRYEIGVVTKLKKPFKVLSDSQFGAEGDPEMQSYLNDPNGSVYGTNGVFIGMKRRSGPDQHDPDLFVFGVPGVFRGYYPGWSKDAVRKDYFSWLILKGHTENTAGDVTLRSRSPFETPEINFRYFEEGNDQAARDMEAVLSGVKFARKINQKLGIKTIAQQEIVPGPSIQSDDEIRKFIHDEAWGHHASCSNKMGPANDPMAVVDSRFRVHGTEGLRVVDASVFPRIPGLFIVVPTYMISEKASDAILEDAEQGR